MYRFLYLWFLCLVFMSDYPSFHHLLQSPAKLLHRGIAVAAADIIHHAALDMALQKHLVEAVKGRLDRCHLGDDIHTVALVLHHGLDTPYLSLYPVKPDVYKRQ